MQTTEIEKADRAVAVAERTSAEAAETVKRIEAMQPPPESIRVRLNRDQMRALQNLRLAGRGTHAQIVFLKQEIEELQGELLNARRATLGDIFEAHQINGSEWSRAEFDTLGDPVVQKDEQGQYIELRRKAPNGGTK